MPSRRLRMRRRTPGFQLQPDGGLQPKCSVCRERSSGEIKNHCYDSCNGSWLFLLCSLCYAWVCKLRCAVSRRRLVEGFQVLDRWLAAGWEQRRKGAGDSGSVSRHVHLASNRAEKLCVLLFVIDPVWEMGQGAISLCFPCCFALLDSWWLFRFSIDVMFEITSTLVLLVSLCLKQN